MSGVLVSSDIAPGTVLAGKYRVERIIGQGGMGVVVEARHTFAAPLGLYDLVVWIQGDGTPAGTFIRGRLVVCSAQ